MLLLLDTRGFRPHWFETGSPAFLLDLLARRGVASFGLDGMEADEGLLSAFDVERIAPEALLWQTGYLTIEGAEEEDGDEVFRLGYPNLEVHFGEKSRTVTAFEVEDGLGATGGNRAVVASCIIVIDQIFVIRSSHRSTRCLTHPSRDSARTATLYGHFEAPNGRRHPAPSAAAAPAGAQPRRATANHRALGANAGNRHPA